VKELKETRRGVARERAILVEVITASESSDAPSLGGEQPEAAVLRSRDRLEELGRLADAAGAKVVASMTQRRNFIHPGTYIGQGKVEELGLLVKEHRAQVVIFDSDLSPAQVRNLEKATECKTIDRSELILDIFATRARTTEARLQVELAQLEYTLPRLKQMWGHLSRMEGGGGIATRGPGETQLESDRRLARDRIVDLRRRLREIDRRKEREVLSRGGMPTVGLVGYTNAGKSSLLNALTGADAYVEDKLFATLDTRTRGWSLPHGVRALLSDTVGFIRDLPHHLVASFKATLEEAVHADLLLHVVDVSTEHIEADLAAVERVLDEIGCRDKPQLVVLNKADAVADPMLIDLARRRWPVSVVTSALTRQGLDDLAWTVMERLVGPPVEIEIRAPAGDGRLWAWVERHATVLERRVDDGTVVQSVRMPERLAAEALRLTSVREPSSESGGTPG
jgi:GTPase